MRKICAIVGALSLAGAAQSAPLFTASADEPSAPVKTYDTPGLAITQSFVPFGPGAFGASVAAARNGNGSTTLVVGAGQGGQLVKALNASDNSVLLSFLPFDPSYISGVRVAAGDVNGDGVADIAVGTASGGSAVKIFDGSSGAVLRSFLAFAPSFTGGVSVALGDVTGDGLADLVVGAGGGGAPVVKVFDGATGLPTATFMAFDPSFMGGVSVALGRNAIGNTLIVGQLAGGGEVNVFDAATFATESAFFAFAPGYTGGVSVAAGSFGSTDSLYVGGLGNGIVNVYDANSLTETTAFTAYARGGANVAGVFGAVPEPASWALMVAGFGAIGVARRRQARPARA